MFNVFQTRIKQWVLTDEESVMVIDVLRLKICKDISLEFSQSFICFKVIDSDWKEALPVDSCFEDNEHELMMQCCERQRYRRLKLSEVKAKLIEMHENAGTCTYCFYYVVFYFVVVVRVLHACIL